MFLEDLLAEEKEQRFSVQNMSIYLAMQLYVLYCRYAMERKKKEGIQKDEVWNIIQRVLLDTSKTVSLEEYVGKKIRLAFHYQSTSTTACTVEVKNMSVKE